MTSPRRVVAFVPDLMDRSKVQAACPSAIFVPAAADLAGTGADLLVVDLSRSGVLEAIAGVPVPVVGFASHVDRDTIAAAEAAGVRALPRSEFFRRIGELLS